MSKFTLIRNQTEYESAVASIDVSTLPEQSESRFERIDKTLVEKFNEWFIRYVIPAILMVSDAEFALWLLGATPVEPTQGYDFKLGSGKNAVYYRCSNNIRNRIFRNNSGLKDDISNGLIGLGPVGHIGPRGETLSLQHRLKLALQIWHETGVFPDFQVRVDIGIPVVLAGTLDRNIPRKQSDQEYMDSEQFPMELLKEYYPDIEDLSSKRSRLTTNLVSVRGNVFSRMAGNSFHPSGNEKPTGRQELETEALFGEHVLQRVLCLVDSQSFSDDGKKRPFAERIPLQELVSAIVLSQLRNCSETSDIADCWNESEVDTIVSAFSDSSESGPDQCSQFLRELVTFSSKKKLDRSFPTVDRLRFCGLVRVVGAILQDTTMPNYFPTDTEAKNLKGTAKKPAKLSYPRFGGLDSEKDDE